eukprot:366488-Chlamydomonas_euryale.AAC.1
MPVPPSAANRPHPSKLPHLRRLGRALLHCAQARVLPPVDPHNLAVVALRRAHPPKLLQGRERVAVGDLGEVAVHHVEAVCDDVVVAEAAEQAHTGLQLGLRCVVVEVGMGSDGLGCDVVGMEWSGMARKGGGEGWGVHDALCPEKMCLGKRLPMVHSQEGPCVAG